MTIPKLADVPDETLLLDRTCDCDRILADPHYDSTGRVIRDAQAGGYSGLFRAVRHPVVATHSDDTRTHVVALTSQPVRRDGTCRPEVPNPHDVGLKGRSFIFQPRTVRLSGLDLDLDLEVGQADHALVELIIDTVPLPAHVQAALRATVCPHEMTEVA